MTVVARTAERVLLDTSVIINFAQAGALLELARYLGERGAIVLDVAEELRRNTDRFPQLANLAEIGWPHGEPLALPPDLLADAEALQRLHSREGAHEAENRGEIATALLAARLRAIAVIDDALGKRLCRMRGVARLSTAQLAAEMVAAGALEDERGFRVFDLATPSPAGRDEYREAVEKAKHALS